MNEPTISKRMAAELFAQGTGAQAGGLTVVGGDEPDQAFYIRQSRWHDRYWFALADEGGAIWGLEWGSGLTEYQEDDVPWQGPERPLKLIRLYAHQITRTVYQPVPPKDDR